MVLLPFILAAGLSSLGASLGPTPIPLWPKTPPGALGVNPADIPTLTGYPPVAGISSNATLLILPGGGYASLARHEGESYARWFSAQGFTCYVLAYRLGSNGYRHPTILLDAARALRTVRSWAKRDGLDPQKIVVIGSSAGGHLASTLLTHYDSGQPDDPDPIERENSRPDAGILCYPVITLEGPFAHAGSRKNLLGPNLGPELTRSLSNQLQVTPQTPPCFLWHCALDSVVAVENSLLFAAALRQANVPFALHIYEQGNHGMGLPATNPKAPPWDQECLFWLRGRGILPPL